MMFAYWILVGLLVGWAGGRLMAPSRALPSVGLLGDLVWGALGAVTVGWAIRAAHGATPMGFLETVLGGVAGALAVTFVQRAYADRYQREAVRP